jgi:hypothetical protein
LSVTTSLVGRLMQDLTFALLVVLVTLRRPVRRRRPVLWLLLQRRLLVANWRPYDFWQYHDGCWWYDGCSL